MRRIIARIYCAVALYAVLGIAPAAQAPPILRVEPWEGDSRIQLVPLDEASASTYARHFESANGRVARQFALKLTNGTESTIAAVALRWTMTTKDGPRVIIERLLNLFLGVAGGGVRASWARPDLGGARLVGDGASGLSKGIRPGECVVVTPGMYYSENQGSGGSWYPELFESTAATARLDVVIFEDGLVVGPDHLATVDAIRARKAAVDYVLGVVKNAQANGEDPTVAIRALAQRRPASPQDPDGITIQMLAMNLLSAPSFSKLVEQWRAVELPNFHR
jgi:hypothetical protein